MFYGLAEDALAQHVGETGGHGVTCRSAPAGSVSLSHHLTGRPVAACQTPPALLMEQLPPPNDFENGGVALGHSTANKRHFEKCLYFLYSLRSEGFLVSPARVYEGNVIG